MPAPKSVASTSAKKPRPRPGESSRSTKSALSQEFVRDSDESDNAPVQAAKKSSKAKSQPQKQSSTPIVTSEAPKQQREVARQKPKSSSVSTSSLPEEEEATTNTEEESLPSPKAVSTPDAGKKSIAQTLPTSNGVPHSNGIKRKRDGQRVSADEAIESGTNSSEDEDNDDGKDDVNSESDVNDTSEESSETGGGSESEDQGEEETSSTEKNVQSSSQGNNDATHSAHNLFERPRTVFEPPPGFQPATVSFPPSSELSDILKPSNLKGKQIWHISVPAHAPFHLVQEISLESLENGSPIFSDGNVDYAASLGDDGENGCTSMLIPSLATNKYGGSTAAISRHLNIRRCLKLPQHILGDHSNSISSAPSQRNKSSTPSRIPQPSGLKMRFRPFGASSESESEESLMGGVIPSQVHGSESIRDTTHPRKRKHAESSPPGGLTVETPSRKSKRPKHAGAETDKQMKMTDTNTNDSLIKSRHEITPLKRKANPLPEETPLDAQDTSRRDDLSDDRARRKEEKRRRKALVESTSTPLPPPSATNTTIDLHNDPSSSKLSKKSSHSKSNSSKPARDAASKPVMSLSEFSARLTEQEEQSRQNAQQQNGADQPTSLKKRHSREEVPTTVVETKPAAPKEKAGSFHTSPFPPMKSKAASEKREEETAEEKAERRRRRKEEKRKAKEDIRLANT